VSEKTQNQIDFPECAKVIAAFKKHFPKLRVSYVRENDKEQGRK
jgi:biotin synthase-like enzyme